MARPIPLELPRRDPREELKCRLDNAPVKHAEAVLSAYEVIQGLYDRGVLDLPAGSSLEEEPVQRLLVLRERREQELDGEVAIRKLIPGGPDRAHAA